MSLTQKSVQTEEMSTTMKRLETLIFFVCLMKKIKIKQEID